MSDNNVVTKLKRKSWSRNESLRNDLNREAEKEIIDELEPIVDPVFPLPKKRKKCKKDKPYKIFVKSKGYPWRKGKGVWSEWYDGWAKEIDRDVMFDKMKRCHGHWFDDMVKVNTEEEAQALLSIKSE